VYQNSCPLAPGVQFGPDEDPEKPNGLFCADHRLEERSEKMNAKGVVNNSKKRWQAAEDDSGSDFGKVGPGRHLLT
jgi:hypothetical protein